MSIRSLCQTNVITISKNSTLKDAAYLMQQHHVGSIVVTEGFNGKRIPAGIITDRDIALSVGSAPNPQDLKVENIMQSQPVSVKDTDGVFDSIIKMREHGIKRLPVLDDEGSLCGIICADDLLSMMADEISSLAKITDTQIKNEQGIRMPTSIHVQL